MGDKIELGIGFQNLQSKLREWEGDKFRKEREREKRAPRRERDIELPEIREVDGYEPAIQSGENTAISTDELDLASDILWLFQDGAERDDIPDVDTELELITEKEI